MYSKIKGFYLLGQSWMEPNKRTKKKTLLPPTHPISCHTVKAPCPKDNGWSAQTSPNVSNSSCPTGVKREIVRQTGLTNVQPTHPKSEIVRTERWTAFIVSQTSLSWKRADERVGLDEHQIGDTGWNRSVLANPNGSCRVT